MMFSGGIGIEHWAKMGKYFFSANELASKRRLLF